MLIDYNIKTAIIGINFGGLVKSFEILFGYKFAWGLFSKLADDPQDVEAFG